ncbi:MAG: thioredoxin-like domain-containing protein [Prevotella sp.]|jgi:thiol-disulfide isomerase/thioredoxin
MIKKLIPALASLFLLPVQAQNQNFTVSVNIPGIQQGSVVSLNPDGQRESIVSANANGSQTITLTGTIDRPTVTALRIIAPASKNNERMAPTREVNFLLEPGSTQITAAQLDSVPIDYEMDSSPLFKEHNVHIKGGRGQEQYQQWRDFIFEAELTAFKKNLAWRDADFGLISGKPSDDKQLVAHLLDESKIAEMKVDSMNAVFCRQHPDNLMALVLTRQRMQSPFNFTNTELDELLKRYAANYDKQGYDDFKQVVEEYRHLASGMALSNVALMRPDKTTVQLCDLVVKGKWNFIDFWASWCGPCRAAIPQVKKMYKELGDKLNVMSVSLDKNEQAWRKAMNEEKMPWTQVICPSKSMKALTTAYSIKAIPYLMIVDPEGHVAISTFEPSIARTYLQKHLNQP